MRGEEDLEGLMKGWRKDRTQEGRWDEGKKGGKRGRGGHQVDGRRGRQGEQRREADEDEVEMQIFSFIVSRG